MQSADNEPILKQVRKQRLTAQEPLISSTHKQQQDISSNVFTPVRALG